MPVGSLGRCGWTVIFDDEPRGLALAVEGPGGTLAGARKAERQRVIGIDPVGSDQPRKHRGEIGGLVGLALYPGIGRPGGGLIEIVAAGDVGTARPEARRAGRVLDGDREIGGA